MPANLVLDRPDVTSAFLPSNLKTNNSLPHTDAEADSHFDNLNNNNNNNNNYCKESDRSNNKKKRRGKRRVKVMSLKEFHEDVADENDVINHDEISIDELIIEENFFDGIDEEDEEVELIAFSDFDDEMEELACYYDEELINHKKSIKNHIFPGCKDPYGRSKRKNVNERIEGHYFLNHSNKKFVKGHRHRKNIRMEKFTGSPLSSPSLHPTRDLLPVEQDWEPIFCEEYQRAFSYNPYYNYYHEYYRYNYSYNYNYSYEKEKEIVPSNIHEIQLKNEIKKSKRERKQMECGLQAQNLEDILYRDLTPEDYELLLKLDENVPKKTVEINIIDSFPSFLYKCKDHNENNNNAGDNNNDNNNINDNINVFKKKLFSLFNDKVDENNVDKDTEEEERKKEEGEMNNMAEKCTICLCEYENDDKITKIPTCGHFFHSDCIYQWLSKSSTKCPLDGLSLID